MCNTNFTELQKQRTTWVNYLMTAYAKQNKTDISRARTALANIDVQINKEAREIVMRTAVA